MVRQRDGQLGTYLEHRRALIAYATPIVGSREAAEDVVQEAYLRIAPTELDAQTPEQAVAYLYRVVRNLAFDLLKRRKVERRGVEADPPFWTMPQSEPTPEQALSVIQQQKVVGEVLAGLDPEARMALELYRFEGRTLEEIAARTGLSVATVHRRIRAAMLAIAAALQESGQ